MATAYVVNPRRRSSRKRTPPRDRSGKFRRRKSSPRRRARRNPVASSYTANRRRRRSSPRTSRRRTYTRNPSMKGLLPFTIPEFLMAGAGSLITRQVPDLVLKAKNRGPVGYLANVATGIVLGILAKKVKMLRPYAKSLSLGAASFASARILAETALKRMGIAGYVDGVGAADLGSDMGYVSAPAMAAVPAAGALEPYYDAEEAVTEEEDDTGDEDYANGVESEWSDFSGLSADDPWDSPA